jgi:hypothetical protein
MPKKDSFAQLVRTWIAEHRPEAVHLETWGGSGPVLEFQWSDPNTRHGVSEVVQFQKGLYGAHWFRINFIARLDAPIRGGQRFSYGFDGLYEGGGQGEYKRDEQLRDTLFAALSKLDAKAKRFFDKASRNYSAVAKLFPQLVTIYTKWLRELDGRIPPGRVLKNGDNDQGYWSFREYLDKHGYLKGIEADLKSNLWHFWTMGRPLRREDYAAGRAKQCIRCKKYKTRATLVEAQDPIFGTYYEFVCQACSRSKSA